MLNKIIRDIYYLMKPVIPRAVQIRIRRNYVRKILREVKDTWPIDHTAGVHPEIWKGWPRGKQFSFIMTHDVENQKGHDRCRELAGIESSLGFRSSFNFVPERYMVSEDLRNDLTEKGFEVGLHGLKHDGKYFRSKHEFMKRARRINRYMSEWNSVGYRSPSMIHNLDYFHHLSLEYDASTFDTDPFEPLPVPMDTIFPFFVHSGNGEGGYVELPYTLPQDFTVFILMKEQTIDIWKRKLDWIAEQGGMALLITHPDYMHFGRSRKSCEEYSPRFYESFLEYVKGQYKGRYWHALPREVARFYRETCVQEMEKGKDGISDDTEESAMTGGEALSVSGIESNAGKEG